MPDGSSAFASDVSRSGGGDRIRTDDRLVANQVLYQLSYAPGSGGSGQARRAIDAPPRPEGDGLPGVPPSGGPAWI